MLLLSTYSPCDGLLLVAIAVICVLTIALVIQDLKIYKLRKKLKEKTAEGEPADPKFAEGVTNYNHWYEEKFKDLPTDNVERTARIKEILSAELDELTQGTKAFYEELTKEEVLEECLKRAQRLTVELSHPRCIASAEVSATYSTTPEKKINIVISTSIK